MQYRPTLTMDGLFSYFSSFFSALSLGKYMLERSGSQFRPNTQTTWSPLTKIPCLLLNWTGTWTWLLFAFNFLGDSTCNLVWESLLYKRGSLIGDNCMLITGLWVSRCTVATPPSPPLQPSPGSPWRFESWLHSGWSPVPGITPLSFIAPAPELPHVTAHVLQPPTLRLTGPIFNTSLPGSPRPPILFLCSGIATQIC